MSDLFLSQCLAMAKFNYRELDLAPSPARAGPQWLASRPEMPYIIPFFAYVVFFLPPAISPALDAFWKAYHPLFYLAKTLTAAGLLWYFWPYYTRIRWTHLPLGAALGVIGTVVWITSTLLAQHIGIGAAPSPSDLYNPDLQLAAHWQRLTFLCIRVAGPTLVVPVMEELFFRDFLMRALIRGAHFEDVPVGAFSWMSLLGMSVLFAVNHGAGMLLPGFLYGLMIGLLLVRTKSLGACITAHAVTNWTLYLYVIYTGHWQFM
jgi:CAAX prenyl protease-like protein